MTWLGLVTVGCAATGRCPISYLERQLHLLLNSHSLHRVRHGVALAVYQFWTSPSIIRRLETLRYVGSDDPMSESP